MITFIKYCIASMFFVAISVIAFLYREINKSKIEINSLKEDLSEAMNAIYLKDKEIEGLKNDVKELEQENIKLRKSLSRIPRVKLSDKKS